MTHDGAPAGGVERNIPQPFSRITDSRSEKTLRVHRKAIHANLDVTKNRGSA
jgi:hypothetical protein